QPGEQDERGEAGNQPPWRFSKPPPCPDRKTPSDLGQRCGDIEDVAHRLPPRLQSLIGCRCRAWQASVSTAAGLHRKDRSPLRRASRATSPRKRGEEPKPERRDLAAASSPPSG